MNRINIDPGVASEIFHELANSYDREANQSIANHPLCPAVLLEKFCENGRASERMLECITKHPNVTAELLWAIAQHARRVPIRASVAKHPRADERTLIFLTNDRHEDVRETAKRTLAARSQK
jgi:hypothetical protein